MTWKGNNHLPFGKGGQGRGYIMSEIHLNPPFAKGDFKPARTKSFLDEKDTNP
jgi:hypothetical protein